MKWKLCYMDKILFAILCFTITQVGCQKTLDSWIDTCNDEFFRNEEECTRSFEYSLNGLTESRPPYPAGIFELGLHESENVLAEGWVNANFLHYSHLNKWKKGSHRISHVALDLKYLLSSTAEQADNSGRMSALGIWLTLLIVAVAAAILS